MEAADLDLLRIECERSDAYPRTVCLTGTSEYALQSLETLLEQRRRYLFCSSNAAAVAFWELARLDEGYQPHLLSSVQDLKLHFGTHFDQRRADPRQRFVFIEAPHSRDPLSITHDMFTYIMTYLQVMPSFLELIFPFGLQYQRRGFHFSTFTAQNHLIAANRGLCIPSLRRSGLHVELCYSLKSVERTPDPNSPWSIRQCSIYHRFDLESEIATWVVVKGNSLVQNLVKSQTENEFQNQHKQRQQKMSPFSSSLAIHAILAAWAGENWHWYINDLEEQLQSITRSAVTIPVEHTRPVIAKSATRSSRPRSRPARRKWSILSVSKSMKRTMSWATTSTERTLQPDEKPPTTTKYTAPAVEDFVEENFFFSDLQTVQHIQEKASQLMLILKSNNNVLESLASNYSMAVNQSGSMAALAGDGSLSNDTFQQRLIDIVKKINMQQSRVETLLQLITERKTILHAILQHRNMEANNRLAQEAKISAKKMEEMTEEMHELARSTKVETVSMRIITLVTLFFLPGTFISTLMSTPIVNFPPNSSGFSANNIGLGALQLFLVISLPLVCLTFVAWYVVYLREKRKDNNNKMDPEEGLESS